MPTTRPLYLVVVTPVDATSLLAANGWTAPIGTRCEHPGEWHAVVAWANGDRVRRLVGVVHVAESRSHRRFEERWRVTRAITLPSPVPLSLEVIRSRAPLSGRLLQVVRRLCREVQNGVYRDPESIAELLGVVS